MKNVKKRDEKQSTKHMGKGEVFGAIKRHLSTVFQEKMHVRGNTGSK